MTESHITTLELYGGKYRLQFNEKTHRYKINGIWTPGVTSILRRLDKGEGLIQWAANLAAESMSKGSDIATAKAAWKTFRDTTANIGKDAHAWIQKYLQDNVKLSLSPEIAPSIEAFEQWWKEVGPFNVQSERIVYSADFNYCGTCDIIFDTTIDGIKRRVVADFKTGSPEREWKQGKGYTGQTRAYAEAFYQCALYDQAIYEEDGLWADTYMVIYLTRDGELFFYSTDDTAPYHAAGLLAVRLSQVEKDLKGIHCFS